MKTKIFTLALCLVAAFGLNAQVLYWNISEISLDNVDVDIEPPYEEFNGLKIYATASSKVTFGNSKRTFEEVDYTRFLKMNGAGNFEEDGVTPRSRVVEFSVNGPGKFRIAMYSNNSTEKTVYLQRRSNGQIIGELPAQPLSNSGDVKEFDYTGGAADICMYGSGNFYIYMITFIPEDGTTGIDLVGSENSMEIFNDNEIVQATNASSITLYSIYGAELQKVASDRMGIRNLPSGVYVVKVTGTDNKIYTKKIIK